MEKDLPVVLPSDAEVAALLDGPTPPGDVATGRAPAAPEAMTVEAVSAEKEAAPMGLRLR